MEMDLGNDSFSSIISFSTIDEKMDKLKEWKILSPKAKVLKSVYYHDKDGPHKCEIVGYITKRTNMKCIDSVYETAMIRVNENIVKIAPAYLLEMQKKDFSIYNSSFEKCAE